MKSLSVEIVTFFVSTSIYGGLIKNIFANQNKDVIGALKCTKHCCLGRSKIIIFHKNELFEREKTKGLYMYSDRIGPTSQYWVPGC